MNLFSKILNRFMAKPEESRALTDQMASFFGISPNSVSGVMVTPDSAMRQSAVFACVRILSETCGSLPLITYQRKGEGKSKAFNHPLYSLLHDKPNDFQTPIEFKEMMTAHVALRGNAYAQIVMNSGGVVEQLIPIHPDRVEPFLMRGNALVSEWDQNTKIYYRYSPLDTGPIIFPQEQIFHLRGFGSDGIKGLSVISYARESIGLAMAAEEHGSRVFANGAAIRGVLQMDGILKEDQVKRLKTQFEEFYSGLRNSGKVAVLESGMKFNQIGMTSRDAEYIELRKFQITDIARIFRIPPHLIGDLEKATFSNIEQQSLEFLSYTMLPWFERWEQACWRDLLSPIERTRYLMEFRAENLLRGDIKSRYEAYAVGRNNGWLTVNDILRLENMNTIGPEGDIRLAPLNMIPLDQVGKVQPQNIGSPSTPGGGSK